MELEKVVERIVEDEELREKLESLGSFEEVYEFFTDNGYEGSETELQKMISQGVGESGMLTDAELSQVAGGVSGRQVLSACAGLMMLMGATPITNLGSYASAESLPSVEISQSAEQTEVKDDKVFTSMDARKFAEKIIVPEGVTKIDDGAFCDCNYLKEVKLPSTVKEIGKDAFWKCYNLENVNIPEGVTKIESNAFRACRNLEEIKLPSTLEVIGDSAFCACSKLKNVKLPSSLKTIGENAFGFCVKFTKISIPEGVTKIENDTFAYCRNLKEVKLPATLTSIGERAFLDCNDLKKIDIPEGVTRIGRLAFKNCRSLKEVKLPSALKAISVGENDGGDGIFRGCSKLRKIFIPDSIKELEVYRYEREGDQTKDVKEVMDVSSVTEDFSKMAFGSLENLEIIRS